MGKDEGITGMSYDRNGIMDYFEFQVSTIVSTEAQKSLQKKLVEVDTRMKNLKKLKAK